MDKFNLQIRLGIILIIFFVIAIVLQTLRSTNIADIRIRQEEESITELVNNMFAIMQNGSDLNFNLEDRPALFQQLMALENIRHIDIQIQSANSENSQDSEDLLSHINAPGWYIAMVYPDTRMKINTLEQSNGDTFSLYIDPGDEIEEVWFETRNRLVASFLFLVSLMAAVVYFTNRWMKPIDSIIDVLEQVELGDFSRRISAFSLPELSKIADHINHLTNRLGSIKSENERLTRKSIMVQEQERRYLAQELHDSLGQSVSAIKAIAVSIACRSLESDPLTSKSARNIEEIADNAYDSVRKLMTSLRPFVLDELGLTTALSQMVDEWNVHHEDTFCRYRFEGEFSNLQDEQQINLYRIVQEALTNISKYAKAENVSITLSGDEIISLLIVDDGIGFAMNEMTRNMGLTGIKDRVTLLQGEFELASKPGRGVSIQIEFPRVNYFRRRSGDYEQVTDNIG
ncbi:MAG: two-component system sensor histidine kinase UhpB [Pseudohongiellaceae bacterium]|jgi:two-component system sensor histidine kinase UhpB